MGKECFEVVGFVTGGVGTPGIDEGGTCGCFVAVSNFCLCQLGLFRVLEYMAVSLRDGFVEVGGDDACVDVVGQCGGIWVMLGYIVRGGDEACIGEGWVHMVG